MWGAIIGDIVGSVYEFQSIKSKDFEFFGSDCSFTDDSICTVAVADILLNNKPPDLTLQSWCRKYPHPTGGYGGRFADWIHEDPPIPYDSFGNGAAMRVSPAAYINRNNSLEEALRDAIRVTEVTHNHPEGLKGANAATQAIWLALQGEEPGKIRDAIVQEIGYNLDRTVDEIRANYRFNEICQETVPEAITCALEATNYEDAIRNTVSLGGDADTLAATAGPIAEALFGIPEELMETAKNQFLSGEPDMVEVIETMYARQD